MRKATPSVYLLEVKRKNEGLGAYVTFPWTSDRSKITANI